MEYFISYCTIPAKKMSVEAVISILTCGPRSDASEAACLAG
jgi:hypothetical protein